MRRHLIFKGLLATALSATALWACAEDELNKRPSICGDKRVDKEKGEECDDGNIDSTDACLPGCKLPKCGDGFVWRKNLPAGQAPEQCDDGNTVDDDDCSNACVGIVKGYCGDGIVQAELGEECDYADPAQAETCRDENSTAGNPCTLKVERCNVNETVQAGVTNIGDMSVIYSPKVVGARSNSVDAVTVSIQDSHITSVSVLVAMTQSGFSNNASLSAVIVDGSRDDGSGGLDGSQKSYVATTRINPAEIQWEEKRDIENLNCLMGCPQQDDNSGGGWPSVKVGWVKIDFSNVIPAEGLSSNSVIVGIQWPNADVPLIGGAERAAADCAGGWSSLADSTRNLRKSKTKQTCTWPMLQLSSGVVSTTKECRLE